MDMSITMVSSEAMAMCLLRPHVGSTVLGGGFHYCRCRCRKVCWTGKEMFQPLTRQPLQIYTLLPALCKYAQIRALLLLFLKTHVNATLQTHISCAKGRRRLCLWYDDFWVRYDSVWARESGTGIKTTFTHVQRGKKGKKKIGDVFEEA